MRIGDWTTGVSENDVNKKNIPIKYKVLAFIIYSWAAVIVRFII